MSKIIQKYCNMVAFPNHEKELRCKRNVSYILESDEPAQDRKTTQLSSCLAEYQEKENPITDGSREKLIKSLVNLEQPCVSWYNGLQSKKHQSQSVSASIRQLCPRGLCQSFAQGRDSKRWGLRGTSSMRHTGPPAGSLQLLFESNRTEELRRDLSQACQTGGTGAGETTLRHSVWRDISWGTEILG